MVFRATCPMIMMTEWDCGIMRKIEGAMGLGTGRELVKG
jgi:hypothetical protein